MDSEQRNPDEFGLKVALFVQETRPDLNVFYKGNLRLMIDNSDLDLEPLFRMTSRSNDFEEQQQIEEFVYNLLRDEFKDIKDLDLRDFLSVKDLILPRIYHESYLDQISQDLITYIPWVNNCIISFVIDTEHYTMSINQSVRESWGKVYDEDIYELSLNNLWEKTKDIHIDILEIEKNNKPTKACLINHKDGYDSSRILLEELRRELMSFLGNEFYIGIPSRDMFFAFAKSDEKTLNKVSSKISEDQKDLPYPISPNLFLCVKDGVAPFIDV